MTFILGVQYLCLKVHKLKKGGWVGIAAQLKEICVSHAAYTGVWTNGTRLTPWMKVPHLKMRNFSENFTWKHINIRLKDNDYDTGWTTQGIVVDVQRGTETSAFSASVRRGYEGLTVSIPNSTTGFSPECRKCEGAHLLSSKAELQSTWCCNSTASHNFTAF
jgi:hypothetical protein